MVVVDGVRCGCIRPAWVEEIAATTASWGRRDGLLYIRALGDISNYYWSALRSLVARLCLVGEFEEEKVLQG